VYRNADDIVRVYSVFKTIHKIFRIDFPVWLTETNAMPTDDRALASCDHAADSIPTTMEQQAAYAVQAFAMAAAAGYGRAGFYQMIDDNACQQPAVWGAVRDNGSKRPMFDALRTIMRGVGGFTQVRFAPMTRAEQKWSVWPEDPGSYFPNWQVYEVVFDLPGSKRATVLWNADGQPACVRVLRAGGGAQLVDKHGASTPAAGEGGMLQVQLLPATAHFAEDPAAYYFIGGDPVLLIEEGVAGNAPVSPPVICAP